MLKIITIDMYWHMDRNRIIIFQLLDSLSFYFLSFLLKNLLKLEKNQKLTRCFKDLDMLLSDHVLRIEFH